MRKIIINIFKFVIHFLVLPGLTLKLLQLVSNNLIYLSWVTSIITIYMYWVMLINISMFDINLKRKNKQNNIYQWLDHLTDSDELLVYMLEKQKVFYRVIENLQFVKNSVMAKTKENKEVLKLYRAFYKQQTKENSDQLYWTALLTLFSSLIVLFIREFLISKKLQLTFNSAPDYFLLIMLIVVTIAYFIGQIQKNKKRNGIIIEIIDVCIEELEEKDK